MHKCSIHIGLLSLTDNAPVHWLVTNIPADMTRHWNNGQRCDAAYIPLSLCQPTDVQEEADGSLRLSAALVPARILALYLAAKAYEAYVAASPDANATCPPSLT